MYIYIYICIYAYVYIHLHIDIHARICISIFSFFFVHFNCWTITDMLLQAKADPDIKILQGGCTALYVSAQNGKFVLQRVAVCCSVLHSVVACCRVYSAVYVGAEW